MAKDDIVDAEEGAPSTDTFATGIVIFTTIALVVGFLIIQMALKDHYGRGMLGGERPTTDSTARPARGGPFRFRRRPAEGGVRFRPRSEGYCPLSRSMVRGPRGQPSHP